MGFNYLLAGFLFLLNPDVVVLDLLPDFIGYLLIMKGLSKASKISLDFASSRKYFGYLFILSLVKIPLYLAGLAISASDTFMILLCTSVIGIIDAVLAFSAFSAFFNAISASTVNMNLGERDTNTIFGGYEKIKKFTLAFTIIKPATYILPELTRLDNSEYGEVTVQGVVSLFNFYIYFVAIFVIIGLIVGIVWYTRIRKYVKGLIGISAYTLALEEKYNSVYVEDSTLRNKDTLFISLSLLTAAFVMTFKLQLDGINYLIPTASAVLLCLVASRFGKLSGINAKKFKTFSLIYLVLSAVYWIYNYLFVKSFIIIDNSSIGMTVSYAEQLDIMLATDFGILYGFIGLCIGCVVVSVCLILLVNALFRVLKAVMVENRVCVFEKEADILKRNTDIFANEENDKLVSTFKLCRFLALLMPVMDVAQTALSALFAEFWLIDSLVRIIFIVLACHLISQIKDSYKKNNYLE